MTARVIDPSRDIRDRIADGSGVSDHVDKMWFHKTASAVIDADRCVQCGACIAACPSNSIGVAEDMRPTLIRMCTGCSFCWDACPMAGLRSERLWTIAGNGAVENDLGDVILACSASAKRKAPRAQDGGVATALLARLLEDGVIDGVILGRKGPAAGGSAFVARTPEDVIAGAGSVYNSIMALATLSDLRDQIDSSERLALVGTPCQVNGLRALQRYPWPYRSTPAGQVVLTIGLFCTRSFDLPRLQVQMARHGVDPSTVDRVQVSEGELTAHDADGGLLVREPVRAFDEAAFAGCAECADSTGRLADISLGSVGSADGKTTAVMRTPAGLEAWVRAKDLLEVGPVESLPAVGRFERNKRRRALRTLRRRFDEKGPLLVSYREHLAAYAGSDRAPVTPPGHRSHHYQVSC